ncbi:MAG TPA: hypothetical protein VFN92_06060 [Solirubrobacterales bacterium]|nr:hypothetical protein [Solirubrobacterales bacterium]
MQTMAPPEDAAAERFARLDERFDRTDERVADVDRRVAEATKDTRLQFDVVNRRITEASRETDRRITEASRETDRRITQAGKETDRRLKEVDRRIGETNERLNRVETGIRELRQETKGEMGELRKGMESLHAGVHRATVALWVASAGVIAAILAKGG